MIAIQRKTTAERKEQTMARPNRKTRTGKKLSVVARSKEAPKIEAGVVVGDVEEEINPYLMEWETINEYLDLIGVNTPEAADDFARILAHLQIARCEGPPGAIDEVEGEIFEAVFQRTETYQLALRLYHLFRLGWGMPGDEPVELLKPAIERDEAEMRNSLQSQTAGEKPPTIKGRRAHDDQKPGAETTISERSKRAVHG
jgi:hypothetical protein